MAHRLIWLAVALAYAPPAPPVSATATLTARDVTVVDVTVSHSGARVRLTVRLLDATDVRITAPHLTQRATRITLRDKVVIDCSRMSATLFDLLRFQLEAPPGTVPVPVPLARLDDLILEEAMISASSAQTQNLRGRVR